MKRLLPLLLAAACGQAAAEEERVWRTDMDAARAEARESGRPLLVVFR